MTDETTHIITQEEMKTRLKDTADKIAELEKTQPEVAKVIASVLVTLLKLERYNHQFDWMKVM